MLCSDMASTPRRRPLSRVGDEERSSSNQVQQVLGGEGYNPLCGSAVRCLIFYAIFGFVSQIGLKALRTSAVVILLTAWMREHG